MPLDFVMVSDVLRPVLHRNVSIRLLSDEARIRLTMSVGGSEHNYFG
jgi:hypothetical protein